MLIIASVILLSASIWYSILFSSFNEKKDTLLLVLIVLLPILTISFISLTIFELVQLPTEGFIKDDRIIIKKRHKEIEIPLQDVIYINSYDLVTRFLRNSKRGIIYIETNHKPNGTYTLRDVKDVNVACNYLNLKLKEYLEMNNNLSK